MTSVSKKRAKRQQEKRVKRMNLINEKKRRRRKQHPGKILTPQQRRKRNETIKKSIERKAERKKLRAEKRLHDDKQRKITKVHSLFPSLIMDSLAKSTNFIRRHRELSAFAFVYMMSFGHLGNADISLSGLTSLLSTDFCEFITPAGLCKRNNSKNSPAFLKSMLEMLMARGIDKLINRELKNGLSMFSSVLIEDSTQIALNAMAATKYGGSGGSASKSSVKIHYTYDILNHQMCDFKLTEGILPDQSNAINVIRFLKPHALVIRDLGYFSIDSLRMIESKLANYLSRLPFGVNIYLTSTDIRPLDVPKYLEKMMKRGQKSIAFDIYIGKEERYKTTLIAGTVPPSVVAKRINKYTKENGKKPSEGFKEWNGYTIFATNISLKMLTPIAIITLYKIRWQVELAFKDFKSNYQIDYIKGTSPERIESMIYGRLITIAAVFIISGHLSARLDEGKEISVYKLTKFLKIENRLKGAIKNNTLDELLILVEEHVEDVCKQVRSKKTTIQEILEVLTPPEIKEFDVAVNF